jgi:DNA-binding CsgD family transcriptional regulator
LEENRRILDPEERQLSDRERTVLLLAAEGLTDKEIAKHLSLSQRTIGTYWERMRQKLGPFSRTQLVARFLRLESDLDRQNENYRNVFAGWDEGVWIVSSAGKTMFANQPLASLLRVPLAEVLRSDGLRLLKDYLGKEFDGFLDAVKKGHSAVEVLRKSAEGTSGWLRFRGSPVTDRRGEASSFVIIVQDQTAPRLIKQGVDSLRSTLDTLAEHGRDPVIRINEALVVVGINGPGCDLLGVAPQSLVGKRFDEIEAFQPALAWCAAIDQAVGTGAPATTRVQVQNRALTAYLVPVPEPEIPSLSVYCFLYAV